MRIRGSRGAEKRLSPVSKTSRTKYMPGMATKDDAGNVPDEEVDEIGEDETGAIDGTGGDPSALPVKNRPRRKATEKPTGPDALRQSFSKRKKGITAKAYQLNRLTGAKVALFVVNEKGSSWAYATPDFGVAVSPAYLSLMRKLAQVPNSPKLATEVIPHPAHQHTTDDREDWQAQLHPALAEQQQATGAPHMYKIQPGPGVVTMLHHGFHAAGQAVGHPTGHVSIVHPPQPTALEDPTAVASNVASAAGAHMFAAAPMAQGTAAPLPIVVSSPAAPVSSGSKDVHTGKGLKRPGNLLSPKSDAAKKAKEMAAEAEKPRMTLTRQAAILPVEAPPPEGVFGKPQHNPFAPGPHQNI